MLLGARTCSTAIGSKSVVTLVVVLVLATILSLPAPPRLLAAFQAPAPCTPTVVPSPCPISVEVPTVLKEDAVLHAYVPAPHTWPWLGARPHEWPPTFAAAAAAPATLPVAPTVAPGRSASTAACRGGFGGPCVFSNTCYVHGSPTASEAERGLPGSWLLYTGEGTQCITDGVDGGGAPLCAGDTLRVNGTFGTGGVPAWSSLSSVFFRVVAGAPPAGARWYGENDVAIIVAHTLNALNYWHSITDHALPLFWQLRWLLGHRSYLRDLGAPASEAGQQRVLFVPLQTNGDSTFQNIISVFPSLTHARPDEIVGGEIAPSPAPPADAPNTACFRLALSGSSGATVGRNAAAGWNQDRSMTRPVASRLQMNSEVRAMADHLAHWLLPPPPPRAADAEAAPASITRRLVLVSRKGGKREWTDVGALADRIRTVVAGAAEPWEVVVIELESLSQRDVASVISKADMLVGVCGAGLTNMIHMPPGGTVIEVSPCSTPTHQAYAQIAWPLGHTHHFFSTQCTGDWQSAVDANTNEFMTLLAIILPVEW